MSTLTVAVEDILASLANIATPPLWITNKTPVSEPMPESAPTTRKSSHDISSNGVSQNSHLPILGPSPLHERRPLRKLKSSLKLPGLQKSFLTSQLSPSKLVRFASRLENVKTFHGRDSPLAVSLTSSPVGLPSHVDFDLDDYFSARGHWADFGLDNDSDSCLDSEDSDTFSNFTKDRTYKISSSNFSAAHSIYDKTDSVYLQLAVVGADKKLLVLLVMCRNLAFEKKLSVKLTFNNWHSCLILNNASYVKSFPSVNYDCFKVVLPLVRLPSAVAAQFCIKYSVDGQDFWDNNGGQNYLFSMMANPTPVSAAPRVPVDVPRVDSFTYKTPVFKSTPPSIQVAEPRKSSVPYDELINRLFSVSQEEHDWKPQKAQPKPALAPAPSRPLLPHSNSAPNVQPRYSQNYRARQKVDSPPAVAAKPFMYAVPVASAAAADESTPPSSSRTTPKETLVAAEARPLSFLDSMFNSSLYAALLQTYCFGGTAKAEHDSTKSLSMSLRVPLHHLASADFILTGLAFHSMGDTIHI